MMQIIADTSSEGSAFICRIRLISGETHRQTRRLEVAQSPSRLTFEIAELFLPAFAT
jgi:hypothetical protein